MGTPQRGADDAEFLKKLLSALGRPVPRYVNDLGKDSSVLSDINFSFEALLRARMLPMAAFYETNPMLALGVNISC